MRNRYIAWSFCRGRRVPLCNLPGSPFTSRLAALKAAHRAGITEPRITTVRRRVA